MDIKIKTRKGKILYTKENPFTVFLYSNLFGRIILKIINKPVFSKVFGFLLSSKISKLFIKSFIKSNSIDMSEYEKEKYNSFNDFFIRKIKSRNRPIGDKFISPCDSKLIIHTIDKNSVLKIKNSRYKINELINNELSNEYNSGYVLVFRLCKDDYHRYGYIDDGYQEDNIKIKGLFHPVRPIAINNYPVFKQNSREWTILKTKNFDEVIQIEVGALNIGKIVNLHSNYSFKKGEEKGYFKFGASTIILLIKKDIIKIDKDILKNSKNDIETIVRFGENIGEKLK